MGSPTHTVVVVAGCRNSSVETGWAHVARKHYSHLSGRECSLGWEQVLLVENADYCKLVNGYS